jgi:DNA polymerase I
MQVIPSEPEAMQLLMEGSAAFADMESRGMRIKTDYLDAAIEYCNGQARKLEQELKNSDVWSIWRKNPKADLGSRQQLAEVIYDELGYECKKKTKKENRGTDEEAFEHIDHPFVGSWLSWQRFMRTSTSDLQGTKTEVDSDGFLHPHFGLNIAQTYRGNSRNPNFQNYVNRNKEHARIVRRAFIPRDENFWLIEADYGALEFRGAASFWEDPAMIAYASDSTLDIHRDTTADCYKIPRDQVTKAARGVGKNSFVFPRLYGSWYKNIAKNLWDQIGRNKLTTVDGVCLYENLRQKGIPHKAAYIDYVKSVEDNFNGRFKHWSNTHPVWWDRYLKNGAFPLKSGFVCRGLMSYNNVMNYPIQGPSFHILLWALIQMNKWLKDAKFKSCIIGQIHDSIVMDVHESEMQEVLNRLEYYMTVAIKERFPWIATPMEVEVEGSPVNWFEKKELVKDTTGMWVPAS